MAGRPATTGESPIVRFRARGLLAGRLEKRRTYPDLCNEPSYGGPAPKDGEAPAVGTVAYRDLVVYYQLLDAELADAAAELDLDQVLMILEAVQGLATDVTWTASTPVMLAQEIEEGYSDDEDGPTAAAVKLAGIVRSWPLLRALAVLEACLAVRDNPVPDHDLGQRLADIGLTRPNRAR